MILVLWLSAVANNLSLNPESLKMVTIAVPLCDRPRKAFGKASMMEQL